MYLSDETYIPILQIVCSLNHNGNIGYFCSPKPKATPWSVSEVNTFWPSDAIWRHRSGWTLAELMLIIWWHRAISWTNIDSSSMDSVACNWKQLYMKCTRIQYVTWIRKLPFWNYSFLPGTNRLISRFLRYTIGCKKENVKVISPQNFVHVYTYNKPRAQRFDVNVFRSLWL